MSCGRVAPWHHSHNLSEHWLSGIDYCAWPGSRATLGPIRLPQGWRVNVLLLTCAKHTRHGTLSFSDICFLLIGVPFARKAFYPLLFKFCLFLNPMVTIIFMKLLVIFCHWIWAPCLDSAFWWTCFIVSINTLIYMWFVYRFFSPTWKPLK